MHQAIVEIANSNSVQVIDVVAKKQLEINHNSYSIVEKACTLLSKES